MLKGAARIFVLCLLVCTLLAVPSYAQKKDVTLTVVWHAGICAETLLNIAKDYTKQTGVKVVGALVPYGPQWHDKIASEFAAHGSGFDLAAWDSQSVAEFAGGGHCVLLNPLMEKSKKLKKTDFTDVALARYGEFPDGSGKYYALPINQDCIGLMYRKDLFENPKEKEAFKKKYNKELKVPDTYQDLKDIAEFFTRPDQKLWGWAMYGGREYDYCTSSSNCFVWCFGGELWNPKTNEFKGYIDSPASIDGIKFYVDMFKYCPPGAETWGYDEVNTAFQQGQVAMAQQWFYFFGSMLDRKISKVSKSVGFAMLPGAWGRDGLYRREYSMGGQGIGISKYSKNLDEAWKFIEWYEQHNQQMRYAMNCQTGRASVMKEAKWLKLNPYNALFAKALLLTNDYWHVPEYAVLLDIMQEEVNNAIVKKKTAEQAMADCANRQEQAMTQAGYKITRTAKVDVPDTVVNPIGQKSVYSEKK